jgi:hypothetical protein
MMATALLTLAVGCDDVQDTRRADSNPAKIQLALDNMYEPPKDMTLVLVADDGDWKSVAEALDEVGGKALHVLPPRLIVAQVPAGADPVLSQSGMANRFDRALLEGEIPKATDAETRFARVFNNRYYPVSVPEGEKLMMRHVAVPPGEQWESDAKEESAQRAKSAMEKAATTQSVNDDIASESWLYVPYASGTVVVSVWLPESNGVSEPSTEDWTEDQIAEVYQKIQTALEAFARHEPNSKLRFVLHYESAPDSGGLPGTIDHDWEFGKQAQWGEGNEPRSVAALLGKVLQRDVDTGNSWEAYHDYLNGLRASYNADAAFVVMVACNGNWTAGLRAHASLFGPSTTLHSLNDWNVFMHEFGHIFGAGDEYCPDACWSPTSMQGYLGSINANATYQDGGPGINNGRGEAQPSLMTYNVVDALNGYTRSALGWLDSDGDGLVEVRDTHPRSDLEAVVYRGGSVHLQGWIVDVPQSSLWLTHFSANRITKLQYRFADIENSPWFEAPLAGQQRGREQVNVNIGTLPFGAHTIEARAINSVGNAELKPKRFVVEGSSSATAPRLRLKSPLTVGGLSTRFSLDVAYLDLDGDAVTVALDLDADGVLETVIQDPSQLAALRTLPLHAGRNVIRAMATDSTGLSSSAELTLLVLDGNAPPSVNVEGPSNQVNGSSEAAVQLRAADVLDPEGEQVLYNWIVEVAGDPYNPERRETGFGENATFDTTLRTPSRVVTHPFDLSNGPDGEIHPSRIRAFALLQRNAVALALGKAGVAVFDISDRKAPVLLSHLELETSAYHLFAHGNRLFVLGGQLAIVDISNLSAPRELKQWRSTISSAVTKFDEARKIMSDGSPTYHDHFQPRDEKIADVSVKVVVDHPDPSKLTIALESDKEVGLGSIVLMDQNPKAKNRRTFNFNPSNTPNLAIAIGAFTGGNWNVVVYDQSEYEPSGDPTTTGSLLFSRVRFDTEHRAIPVLPGAGRIVGTVPGNGVVVAGQGIQVMDASLPNWATQASLVSGHPVVGADLVNNIVVGAALSEKKPMDEELEDNAKQTWPATGKLSGLFALDLSSPYFPRVKRTVPTKVEELVLVGSRMYATLILPDAPKGTPLTLVGSVSSFIRGKSYELGRTDHRVRRGAFGDDSELWTLNENSRLSRLDVSDPRSVLHLETIDEPYMEEVLRLSDQEILGRNWESTFIANLQDRVSTVSRVYQVTLEAKDDSGSVTKKVRNLHVVPYAHAPSIVSVEVVSGKDENDTYTLEMRVEDPDLGHTWDPYTLARVDFDGDGVLESHWFWGGQDGLVNVYQKFPSAGTYNLLLEARDGFLGRSEPVSFTVVVPPHVVLPCGGSYGDPCEADEFCQRLGEQACDKATVGTCQPLWQNCPKTEMEQPACGCNGVTYHRSCDAYYEGVNVASLGECPVVSCTTNKDCTYDRQFCFFETNTEDFTLSCGKSGPGICQKMPERCYIIYRGEQDARILPRWEVCGCDGQVYNSTCAANINGVSVLHDGVCQEQP